MRKVILAILLSLACLVAVSAIASAAGLANGDWPKPRRDMWNRGCSPTTAVALPSIGWLVDIKAGLPSGAGASCGTYTGPILDANYIYTCDYGDWVNGDIFAFSRNTQPTKPYWVGKTSSGGYAELAPVWYYNMSGLSLYNDGNKNYVLAGPGATPPSAAMWWLDATTGVQPAGYGFTSFAAPTADYVSYDAPTIGPDGTVYIFVGDYGNMYYSGGTVYAIDGITHTLKWSWGADGTVPGGASLGFRYGPMCITSVNGKNLLIVNGTINADNTASNVYALQDDGSSCSVIWQKRTAPSRWSPTISNDGQTVYIGTEQWQKPASGATLFAYDVVSGADKWSLNVRAELNSSPAIGSDGTIYLASTCIQGTLRDDPSGKLIAVKDNGGSGAVKWTMYLDYESDSWFSSPVVTSGTPPTIYFGSTSGRTYAVQDLGTSYKLLWSYARPEVGTKNWPVPVIANDGKVYIQQGQYLAAFKTGYVDGAPLGVTGYVKNTGGDPLSGVYVNASKTNGAMLDYSAKWFVKTDSTGKFNITLPAGTWYLQAWTQGRLLTAGQTVVVPTDGAAVTASDIVMSLAGQNIAYHCPSADTNSLNDPAKGQGPEKAFDGSSTNGRFTSNESGAAISATAPVWLMADLGSNQAASEAVVKWEAAYAINYKIQCLADDGTGLDPKNEANWTAKGVTVASTTKGAQGLPYYWIGNGNIWGRAEIARFAPATGRWWRIVATQAALTNFLSVWEFELHNATWAGPASGQCGDIRSLNPGDKVALESKRITGIGGGVPTDTAYVEDANRASAIRIHVTDLVSKSLGLGDKVDITGTLAKDSATNEFYVEASTINRTSSPRPLDAVVMSSRAANDKASKGLFVKMTGKVEPASGSESFILNDGGATVKVYCGSIPAAKYPTGSNVKVRGVISTDGSKATLLVSDEMDIAEANTANQLLPLPGAMKYFRDCLIIGPFTNSSITGTSDQEHADNLMAEDYLGGEASVEPSIGDPVLYNGQTYKWQRYDGANDIIDFNNFFRPSGAQKTWAAAYAVVYIYNPSDTMRTVDLTAGSDDELKIYSNGNQIFLDQELHGCGYSQSSNMNNGAGVDLNPGLNVFVFKVINGGGDFRLCANIIEWGTWLSGSKGWGDGMAVLGLGYYANKPQ